MHDHKYFSFYFLFFFFFSISFYTFLFHSVYMYYLKTLKIFIWGFPGSAVVKNPPANSGDTGWCPGPGGPHMPQSN